MQDVTRKAKAVSKHVIKIWWHDRDCIPPNKVRYQKGVYSLFVFSKNRQGIETQYRREGDFPEISSCLKRRNKNELEGPE